MLLRWLLLFVFRLLASCLIVVAVVYHTPAPILDTTRCFAVSSSRFTRCGCLRSVPADRAGGAELARVERGGAHRQVADLGVRRRGHLPRTLHPAGFVRCESFPACLGHCVDVLGVDVLTCVVSLAVAAVFPIRAALNQNL